MVFSISEVVHFFTQSLSNQILKEDSSKKSLRYSPIEFLRKILEREKIAKKKAIRERRLVLKKILRVKLI